MSASEKLRALDEAWLAPWDKARESWHESLIRQQGARARTNGVLPQLRAVVEAAERVCLPEEGGLGTSSFSVREMRRELAALDAALGEGVKG